MNGPKISFTPSFSDIEGSIVEVYTMMKNAVYDLQRLDSLLLEEEVTKKPRNLKPILLPEILDTAKVKHTVSAISIAAAGQFIPNSRYLKITFLKLSFFKHRLEYP